MGDQRHQRAVAGQDGGRHEGEAGVLHPAVGEAGRQHEQVVTAPAVGPVETLGRLHHLLDVGELPRRLLDDRRLGVHARPLTDGAELEVADAEGDQVRRHGLRHREPVVAVRGPLDRVLGAHHRQQVRGHPHGGGVGDPHGRAVLARDPGAGQDRLGLREEEALARGRLLGLQPLERASARGGRVANDHPVRVADVHGQGLSEHRVVVPELVGQVGAVLPGHGLDLEVPGVEHQVRGVRRTPVQLPRRDPGDPLPLEVDVELEVEVTDGDPVGTCVGVRIGDWCIGGRAVHAAT